MTSTATNANWDDNYCMHRLPCGYCKELNRACPMIGSTTIGSVGTVVTAPGIINRCSPTGNIDWEADNERKITS